MKKFFMTIAFALLILLCFMPTIAFAADGEAASTTEFFDFGMLGTYSGCLTATLIVTQFIKKFWPQRWPTQYLSYFIAFAILIVSSLALETFKWTNIVLALLNGLVISSASNGVFDTILEAQTGVTAKGNRSALANNNNRNDISG